MAQRLTADLTAVSTGVDWLITGEKPSGSVNVGVPADPGLGPRRPPVNGVDQDTKDTVHYLR
jgi:hypothetical protein